MIRVSLDRRWTEHLLELPESGMGYQRVCVRLKDGRTIENAISLNAEVLELPDDTPPFELAQIADIEVVAPFR